MGNKAYLVGKSNHYGRDLEQIWSKTAVQYWKKPTIDGFVVYGVVKKCPDIELKECIAYNNDFECILR